MVKKKDLLIIYQLRKNARETLTNISKRTRIPISTIYEKLKVNEGNLILKHTSLINFSRLGFNARAKIMVKSQKDSRKEMMSFLLNNQNVNSMYKINNGYDYLVECVFKDMKELEDFVENMDERFVLEKKDIFYVIDDMKREAFLADAEVGPVGV